MIYYFYKFTYQLKQKEATNLSEADLLFGLNILQAFLDNSNLSWWRNTAGLLSVIVLFKNLLSLCRIFNALYSDLKDLNFSFD